MARRALLLVIVAAVTTTGCGLGSLEDEWARMQEELREGPRRVLAWTPGDGPHGVAPTARPLAIFNYPLDDDAGEFATFEEAEASELALNVANLDWSPLPRRRVGDADARGDLVRWDTPWGADGELFAAELVTLGVDGDRVEGLYSTDRHPAPVFDLSVGLAIEALGGNDGQLAALNDLIEPGVYPMWLLQVHGVRGPDTFPTTSVAMHLGPAMLDGDERLLHRDFGFHRGFAPVEVDEDGRVDHAADSLVLVMWSGDDAIPLHLTDVRFEASLSFDGDGELRLDDVRLEAVLGARWLLRLADGGTHWRTFVAACRPDVDTDGNGVEDAATFVITADPERVPEAGWTWD